jgi:uncharacterized GH25 family protein
MNRRMPTTLLHTLLAAACAVASIAASAHDLWLEPSSFRPRAGEPVDVRVRVGEHLIGEPVAYQAAAVRKFFVEDAAGRRTITSREGADPAGRVPAAASGTQVLALWSGPFALVLPAEKFTAYLREEGLEAIEALRIARGLNAEPGREIFSRCAKSLVLAGPLSSSDGDRVLGLPLELHAERDPHTLGGEEILPVRLLWQGRPLAGALVVALNAAGPALKQSARSDTEGRVRFRIDAGGTWLIKAVHMVAAPRGYDADWASWWASLTFERGPGPP